MNPIAKPALPIVTVCLVAPSSGQVGGHAVQAELLRSELRKRGDIAVEFVATDSPFPAWAAGMERVKYVRTIFRTLLYVPRLARAMRMANVTHVLAAAYWAFVLVAGPALLLGAILRRPVIVNYHSGEAADHLRRHPRIVRALLRSARALVVPSEFLQEVFQRNGYSCVRIPNAIPLEKFATELREGPYVRFLCTRSLEPIYDVATIIRAFARIADAEPSATLTVVGAGSQLPRLRRLTDELGLADRVTLTGAIAYSRIADHYRQSDIYLNASVVDNQPLSVLEAMASGMAVVTTGVGGIPDLLRGFGTGVIVPTRDPNAMAEAALKIVRDAGVFAEAERSRARLAATHEPSRVVDLWVSCYRTLLLPSPQYRGALAT